MCIRDSPYLLSTIAGACAAAGANIVDAQVFTTTDGLALDTIFVSREFDMDADEMRRARKIAETIEKSLRGEIRLADLIDANTAKEWGLVSKIVPGDKLMEEAMALAKQIAKQPPHSLRVAKQLLRHGTQATYDTVMEMSAAAQGLMHHTKDHEEGVAAILEKREPVFKGE